jgi:hypothetical protein
VNITEKKDINHEIQGILWEKDRICGACFKNAVSILVS